MAATALKPKVLQSLFSPGSPVIRSAPSQPKQVGYDDLIAYLVPKFPEYNAEELEQAVRNVIGHVFHLLLQGQIIDLGNGRTWRLDEDGRTILVTEPEDDPGPSSC